jgi:dienelactone hydrolase
MIGKSQNRFRSLILHFSGAVVIFFLAALFFISNTHGQNIFSEEIVFISKPGFLSDSKIQTTIFKPSGLGPFPLVIINHGKNLGNPHQQERFRPMAMVQYFIERDYVVVVPMRHGFAQSDGESNFSGNSVELYGLNGIGDLKATIDYAHTLPYVNKNITVMVGQSTGGWVTLAYGTSNPDPSVKGLVNFSGVVKEPCCFGLYNELIDVSGNFGDKTNTKSSLVSLYSITELLNNWYVQGQGIHVNGRRIDVADGLLRTMAYTKFTRQPVGYRLPGENLT